MIVINRETPKNCTDLKEGKHCFLREICEAYQKAHFHEKIQSTEERLDNCLIEGEIFIKGDAEHKQVIIDSGLVCKPVKIPKEEIKDWIEPKEETKKSIAYGCNKSFEVSEKPTPKEFSKVMNKILEDSRYDAESVHYGMDLLLCYTLKALGYEEGVKIFEDTDMWYS